MPPVNQMEFLCLNNPGLRGVTISRLTVINANFEGILVVSAADVTISDSSILDNDKTPGLNFTGETVGCPGQQAFETDETGDCGGAIHLIGVVNSVVSGNQITGNSDGILISDETGESHDNLIIHNTIVDNPLECGIVLGSHPRNGEGGQHPAISRSRHTAASTITPSQKTFLPETAYKSAARELAFSRTATAWARCRIM
jgi:parallel beta-helix repeat protein